MRDRNVRRPRTATQLSRRDGELLNSAVHRHAALQPKPARQKPQGETIAQDHRAG